MKARAGLGLLLVLHGLAHVVIGMAVQDDPHRGLAAWFPENVSVGIATFLFFVVTPGFVAAGLGAWNVPGFRNVWPALVKTCVFTSFVLLVFAAPPPSRLVVGCLLNLAVLAFADILRDDAKPWRSAS